MAARRFPSATRPAKEEHGMWYYVNTSDATLSCREEQAVDSAPALASVAARGVVCVQRRVLTYVDRLAVMHLELAGGHGWVSDRKAPLYTKVLREETVPSAAFDGEERGSWAYQNSTKSTVASRIAPEFPGTRTAFGVAPGQTVRVVRRLRQRVGTMLLTFLELDAGRGWVFHAHPKTGALLLAEVDAASAEFHEPVVIGTGAGGAATPTSSLASPSTPAHNHALLYGRFDLGSLRHMSASSCVYICTDERITDSVALKMCRDHDAMLAEVRVRKEAGLHRGGVVVDVLWANARSKPGAAGLEMTHDAREGTNVPLNAEFRALAARYPYAFAMPVADCDLLAVLARIDVAVVGAAHVRSLLGSIAKLVQALHAAGVVHGELKATNILQKETRWFLADLDAAAPIGSPLGAKAGAATLSPEATRERAAGRSATATIDVDIWAFGLLAYRLCSRNTPVFTTNAQGTMIHAEERARLIHWGGLANEELCGNHVLAGGGVDAADRLFGRDLIGWCLSADVADRPQSMGDILAHPFIIGPCAGVDPHSALRCLAPDGRTQIQHERSAAELLQSIYRGRKQRIVHLETLADRIEMDKAALRLQGIQRGRTGRSKMAARREQQGDEEMNGAALKLQAIQRGRKTKAEVAEMRAEKEEMNGAALKLQAIQRGRKTKAEVAEKRAEQKEMDKAALRLQGIQRGRVAKRRVAEQREALDDAMADEGEDFFAMLHQHRDA